MHDLYIPVTNLMVHNVFTGIALLGANSDMNEAQSLSYRRDIVDIYSNSWGPFDSGSNIDGPGILTASVLKTGVREVNG